MRIVLKVWLDASMHSEDLIRLQDDAIGQLRTLTGPSAISMRASQMDPSARQESSGSSVRPTGHR